MNQIKIFPQFQHNSFQLKTPLRFKSTIKKKKKRCIRQKEIQETKFTALLCHLNLTVLFINYRFFPQTPRTIPHVHSCGHGQRSFTPRSWKLVRDQTLPRAWIRVRVSQVLVPGRVGLLFCARGLAQLASW